MLRSAVEGGSKVSKHPVYNYIQTDGVAMGSPPAPHLANGWMSQFDAHIKGESKLYFRYMDDILKKNKTNNSDNKSCMT